MMHALPLTKHSIEHHTPNVDAGLLADVIRSLTAKQKYLHPKFFYDTRGSELFDRICELPEYYLTRVETAILQKHAPDFVRSLGENAALIELGSGSSLKTRILLDALQSPATYVPVDISRAHLLTAAASLARRYPRLSILPVCADFTRAFALPPLPNTQRSLVFFPGSTIGNFYRDEAIELLKLMRQLSGKQGTILVGTDLRKDPRILERAYNDRSGVTAAFNLNILNHLNTEFGANFDLTAFEHSARWVDAQNRIEMHLISRRDQTVRLGTEHIRFTAGESIWTESCHKYDNAQFAAMARAAGLIVDEVWMDEEWQYGMQRLRSL